MAVDGGNLEVIGDYVEFEAAQAWQETASEKDGIESIDGKGVDQELSFMGEEADIETDIMPDEDGSLNKLEEVGKDLPGAWSFSQHLLGDACKLDDERRQAPIGVHQALK